MSFSPKHTTSFSVTDILSPIEEAYKKTTIEASIPPLLSPYRNAQQYTASAPAAATTAAMNGLGVGGMNSSNAMAYYAAQLSTHPSYTSQYCNTSDTWDPMMQRNAASSAWYGANTDPRLASKFSVCMYLCHCHVLCPGVLQSVMVFLKPYVTETQTNYKQLIDVT